MHPTFWPAGCHWLYSFAANIKPGGGRSAGGYLERLRAVAPVDGHALAARKDRVVGTGPGGGDGDDVLAALPVVRDALRKTAEVIAASPAAQWWTSHLDVADQWTVPWEGAGRPPDDLVGSLSTWWERTVADEEQAVRERSSDPEANWSGSWWSIPPHDLVRTTRSLGSDGPARLWFEEDSFGDDSAVAVPVEAYPARVIEITGPEDWADLCRRHPLDVTASRRPDWYRVTGRVGPWVIPDWRTVATEADAVHLTVAGYLTTATRSVEVGDGRASVLAGWNPDETFWFRGTLARPADEVRWHRQEGEWHPVEVV